MAISDDDLARPGRCVEAEWGAPPPPVAPLPITTVAPGVQVDGPADGYTDQMQTLYQAKFRP